MRVPFAENAEIDIRKLTEYVLNPGHPNGKHKAILWSSALGVTAEDAEELSAELLSAVRFNLMMQYLASLTGMANVIRLIFCLNGVGKM